VELLSQSSRSFPVLRQADRIGEEDLRPFATLLLDPFDEGRHLLGLEGILIRLVEAAVPGISVQLATSIILVSRCLPGRSVPERPSYGEVVLVPLQGAELLAQQSSGPAYMQVIGLRECERRRCGRQGEHDGCREERGDDTGMDWVKVH